MKHNFGEVRREHAGDDLTSRKLLPVARLPQVTNRRISILIRLVNLKALRKGRSEMFSQYDA